MVGEWLVQLVAGGGALGVVAWLVGLMHRTAVAAERRRADDWRTAATEWKAAARAERTLNDGLREQVAQLLMRCGDC